MTTTYDVAAFQGTGSSAIPVLQDLWGPDGDGRLVSGILKLAQRFLLELLTIQGSMPFNQSRGSSLLMFVRQGQIRSEIDANVLFRYCVSQVQTNLVLDQLPTDDPSELYQSVTVNSVTFSPSRLVYSLTLVSQAGTTRVLVLPLAV